MAHAFNPFVFEPIGHRKNGQPIYPILGAEDNPANPVQPPVFSRSSQSSDDGKRAIEPPNGAEVTWDAFKREIDSQGLTPGQLQARLEASRKWEQRAKGMDTPEFKAFREQAAADRKRVEELEYDQSSDKEKAVRSAYTEAEQKSNEKYQPLLVRAEFKAAAAGRIDADKLTTILEPLDLSKFLAADGTPDTAKVAAYVDGIAPAKGNDQRKGPTLSGHGSGTASGAKGSSVAAGRELYAASRKRTA